MTGKMTFFKLALLTNMLRLKFLAFAMLGRRADSCRGNTSRRHQVAGSLGKASECYRGIMTRLLVKKMTLKKKQQ